MHFFKGAVCVMGLFSFLFGGCSKQSTPRVADPNAVTQVAPTQEIQYCQLDITEAFGDNERLKPDEWITTIPLNATIPNGQASGLPPNDAQEDVVYAVAEKMSRIRESIPVANDGIYCPICHIANTQIEKLRTPCPKCGRPLLKFGWD